MAQQLLGSCHSINPAIQVSSRALQPFQPEMEIKSVDKLDQMHDLLRLEKVECYGPKAVAIVISHVGKCREKNRDNLQSYRLHIRAMRKLLHKASTYLAKGMFSQQDMQKIITGTSKFFLNANVAEHAECVTSFYKEVLKLPLDLDALNVLLYSATRLDPGLPLFKKEIPELIERIFSSQIKWNDPLVYEENPRLFSNLIYSLLQLDSGNLICLEAHKAPFKLLTQGLTEYCKAALVNGRINNADEGFHYQQIYLALLFFVHKYKAWGIDAAALKSLRSALATQKTESYISNRQRDCINFLQEFFTPTEDCFEKMIHTLPVDGFFQLAPHHFLMVDVRGPSHYLHDGEEKEQAVLDLKTRMHVNLVKLPGTLPLCAKLDMIDVPYFKLPLHPSNEQMFKFFSERLLEEGIHLERPAWLQSAPSTYDGTVFGRTVVQKLDGTGREVSKGRKDSRCVSF